MGRALSGGQVTLLPNTRIAHRLGITGPHPERWTDSTMTNANVLDRQEAVR